MNFQSPNAADIPIPGSPVEVESTPIVQSPISTFAPVARVPLTVPVVEDDDTPEAHGTGESAPAYGSTAGSHPMETGDFDEDISSAIPASQAFPSPVAFAGHARMLEENLRTIEEEEASKKRKAENLKRFEESTMQTARPGFSKNIVAMRKEEEAKEKAREKIKAATAPGRREALARPLTPEHSTAFGGFEESHFSGFLSRPPRDFFSSPKLPSAEKSAAYALESDRAPSPRHYPGEYTGHVETPDADARSITSETASNRRIEALESRVKALEGTLKSVRAGQDATSAKIDQVLASLATQARATHRAERAALRAAGRSAADEDAAAPVDDDEGYRPPSPIMAAAQERIASHRERASASTDIPRLTATRAEEDPAYMFF